MDFRPGVKVQYTEISIAPTLFLWETHAMQMILLAVLGFCALVASAQDKPEIPDDLLDATGERVSSKKLEGKFVGLYFSASWCGPCRKEIPKLQEIYNDIDKDDFEFQV